MSLGIFAHRVEPNQLILMLLSAEMKKPAWAGFGSINVAAPSADYKCSSHLQ
jgi:hypothetical protein